MSIVLKMLPMTFKNLLASYEDNFHSELARAKQNVKTSGRYNTHDSVVAPPHLSKERVIFDELSLPQWVAGPLSNINNISDPILAK